MDRTGHGKDPGQEDGAAAEHGEEEMDMESEKEEEKPKAGGGAFSNALSSLNVLRPGAPSPPPEGGLRGPSVRTLREGGATRVRWDVLCAAGVSFPSLKTREN